MSSASAAHLDVEVVDINVVVKVVAIPVLVGIVATFAVLIVCD